jgi:hypothetical protein
MSIHVTSHKCTSVILKWKLILLHFIRYKTSSHVYVLPKLAKFRDNLRKSGNRNTGEEPWNAIKACWLKLLCKTEPYCSSVNSSCNFSRASLTSTENGFTKISMRDEGCTDLWNVGDLPQHYRASQPRRWRKHWPPKRWYPTTTLHGVTTQKTSTWNTTAVKASKL